MSGKMGAAEQRANNDRQNLKFAEDVLGRKPNERGKLTKEVIPYDDGPVEFNRPGGDFITSEEYFLRRLRKEYPGQDIDKLLDTSKPSIKEELRNFQGKKIGDQGSADLKPVSQEIASAGISQYTLLNGPENNTIIVQPSGGGMPPPPAQPPQMIAQAPPLDMQMMGGGPSKLDQVLALNTLITFTKLTS